MSLKSKLYKRKDFIEKAFIKSVDDLSEERNPDTVKKAIYWSVCYIPILYVEAEFKSKVIDSIKSLMTNITYREFIQLFPITKEYDGDKFGMKDYYSTIDYLKDFNLDDLIHDPEELIMEYYNPLILALGVEYMTVVSKMSRNHLGLDPFTAFFHPEEYGHDSKGNIIGVTADGKVHKIAAPGREKPILSIVK